MPLLEIVTNVKESLFNETFLKEMTTIMSQLVGKPVKNIAISVRGNTTMLFSGSTDPCALVSFASIGCINEEKNAIYSSAIFKALNDKGIASDRAWDFQKNPPLSPLVQGDMEIACSLIFKIPATLKNTKLAEWYTEFVRECIAEFAVVIEMD